ncbi:uncharacterized protein LOC111947403 isoform X5 [Oryzias latipes]
MLKEEEKRMHLLKEELAREEQQEERKLRLESDERFRTLQLLFHRREGEARLKEESSRTLEELREDRQKQQQKLKLKAPYSHKRIHILMAASQPNSGANLPPEAGWGSVSCPRTLQYTRWPREDREAMLMELCAALEEERAAAREEVEARKKQDMSV